jgi:exonuclease VII small subunit
MSEETTSSIEWGKCIANLDDAIKYLRECREHLEKALKNIGELRDA